MTSLGLGFPICKMGITPEPRALRASPPGLRPACACTLPGVPAPSQGCFAQADPSLLGRPQPLLLSDFLLHLQPHLASDTFPDDFTGQPSIPSYHCKLQRLAPGCFSLASCTPRSLFSTHSLSHPPTHTQERTRTSSPVHYKCTTWVPGATQRHVGLQHKTLGNFAHSGLSGGNIQNE